MRNLACLALAIPILAAACGGNVVVDGTGTGTTTTGTSGTTTSGTTAVTCVQTCEAVAAACPSSAPKQGCAASCATIEPLVDAACPAEWLSYESCIAMFPSEACSGTMTGMCAAQLGAVEPCVQMVCSNNPAACM